MELLIQEDHVFDNIITFQRDESPNLGDGPMFPQSTLKAIIKTRKIFNDPTNTFVLFKPLARLFNPDIDDDQIKEMYTNVCTRGWDVFVTRLTKSYMEAVPVPNSRDSSLQRPKILFENTYACVRNKNGEEKIQQDKRQEFLHVVKIIHEVCHLMVPYFIRSCGVDVDDIAKRAAEEFESGLEGDALVLEKKLNTPPPIGTLLRRDRNPNDPETYYIGDAGSAWEELTFDGRVITCSDSGFPYRGKLILVCREYPDLPPTDGNKIQWRISDEYVQNTLKSLEEWMPGSPFPENLFTLASSSKQLANANVYESRDEVIEKSIACKKRKRANAFDSIEVDDDCSGTIFGVSVAEEQMPDIARGFKV